MSNIIPRSRTKDLNWNVYGQASSTGITTNSIDDKHTALMMDIRDELQKLNALLHCHNFTAIPTILRGIRAKLPARKPAKRAKK